MIYSILRLTLLIILKIVFRVSCEGRENIPRTGGVIVVSNHVSLLDPIVIGCVMPRPICYMAKEELFRVPLLKNLLPRLNVFPVRRGEADRAAIKTAISVVERQMMLGLFPEGTRSKDGRMLKPFLGMAYISAKTDTPVVPVGITGTKRPFKGIFPSKITARIGKPVPPPFEDDSGKTDKDALRKYSDSVMKEVSNLLE